MLSFSIIPIRNICELTQTIKPAATAPIIGINAAKLRGRLWYIYIVAALLLIVSTFYWPIFFFTPQNSYTKNYKADEILSGTAILKRTGTTQNRSPRANEVAINLLANDSLNDGAERSTQENYMKLALEIANKKRAVGCKCGIVEMMPAGPLSWNDSLFKAAYLHAADMAKLNYFSHINKDGRTATDRIIKAGYNYQGFKSFVAGENIAEGQESLPEVFKDWFKSEGHCKNLMNPKFKEVGLAMVNGYWVMDFGGRVVFSEAEQEQIKKGDLKVEDKQ